MLFFVLSRKKIPTYELWPRVPQWCSPSNMCEYVVGEAHQHRKRTGRRNVGLHCPSLPACLPKHQAQQNPGLHICLCDPPAQVFPAVAARTNLKNYPGFIPSSVPFFVPHQATPELPRRPSASFRQPAGSPPLFDGNISELNEVPIVKSRASRGLCASSPTVFSPSRHLTRKYSPFRRTLLLHSYPPRPSSFGLARIRSLHNPRPI